jgi:hypothetical protein
MGLATRLIKIVIDYLGEKKLIHTFRLGSVPLAIGLYKKIGFQAESFTTAQQAELPIKTQFEKINSDKNLKIEKLKKHDLEAVSEIDELFFKSNRLEFLMNIFNDSMGESCLCLKENGRVKGFLMIRRRQASKHEYSFAEGPDYVYRLGPSCILPEYGITAFKALFQEAIQAVNKEVLKLDGSARIYSVFPKNADKDEVYENTRELAKAMDLDAAMDLDEVFDEHDQIFGAPTSVKNEEQQKYFKSLGFIQEYFEQVMSYTPGEAINTKPAQREAEKTRANPEGIFANATPGDKA